MTFELLIKGAVDAENYSSTFYHVTHGESGLCSDKRQLAMHERVTLQEEEWKIEPELCLFSLRVFL